MAAVSLDEAMSDGLKRCRQGLTLTQEAPVLLEQKKQNGKKKNPISCKSSDCIQVAVDQRSINISFKGSVIKC